MMGAHIYAGGGWYQQEMAAHGRRLIEQALRETQGNRVQAARVLGVERAHLYWLMRRLGINIPPTHKLAKCGRRGVGVAA